MKDRLQIIIPLVKDKEVLDFGSVGTLQNINPTQKKKHLFLEMKKYAKDLIGVDVHKSKHQDLGIIQGNAETINLKRTFDVVVMGEIIEHVDNQGLFLDNAYRHLRENGLLIITTPNARSWKTFFSKPFEHHALVHTKETLQQVVEKHGFKTKDISVILGNKEYNHLLKMLFSLTGNFNSTLVGVFQK